MIALPLVLIRYFISNLKAGGGGGGGELGVNKKGTPLYSREDIREQYCINDKELQVLDRSQRKSLLGCFSNQGQVSSNPRRGPPTPFGRVLYQVSHPIQTIRL